MNDSERDQAILEIRDNLRKLIAGQGKNADPLYRLDRIRLILFHIGIAMVSAIVGAFIGGILVANG